MSSLYGLVLLAAVLATVGQIEYYRFKDCHAECLERRELNLELLATKTCRRQKLQHGIPKVKEACWEARQELDHGLYACSLRSWWKQGELKALYARVFESQLMLYGLLLPCLLYVIHKVFALCTERRQQNMLHQERLSFVHAISKWRPPAPEPERVRYVSQRLVHAHERQQQNDGVRRLTNWERRSLKRAHKESHL